MKSALDSEWNVLFVNSHRYHDISYALWTHAKISKEGKAMKLTNEKIQISEKQAAWKERKDEKPTFSFVSIMISIVCACVRMCIRDVEQCV